MSSSSSASPSLSAPSEKVSVFNPSNGMKYTRLGKSGLRVSRVCLGMMSYGTPTWQPWVLGEAEGLQFVKKALDMGINFFDTADVYSLGVSEEILGKAIAKWMKREEVVIATKVYFPTTPAPPGTTALLRGVDDVPPNGMGLSRKRIFDSVDASLKRLGVDYIDLYQIHRFDPNTPIEETMRALHDVVQSGKVRYIGASSMRAYQFHSMQACADKLGLTKFVSMQNHYNLVYREEEREMIPLCKEMGVGLIPWSPLARGLLCGNRKEEDKAMDSKEGTLRTQTDKFSKLMYFSKEDIEVARRVEELANKRTANGEAVSPAMVAMAWVLSKVDSPIVGATKIKHLEEAVAALKVTLTDDEVKFLEEAYVPHKVLGHA